MGEERDSEEADVVYNPESRSPVSDYSSTIRAVTMPNIPCRDSACESTWQWNAHTPSSVASTSASQRAPGATMMVSRYTGAAADSHLPRSAAGHAVQVHGVDHLTFVDEPHHQLLPFLTTMGSVAGKLFPLMLNPPMGPSFNTIVYSTSKAGRLDGSFGSMMNAPSNPFPTCSVAL